MRLRCIIDIRRLINQRRIVAIDKLIGIKLLLFFYLEIMTRDI